LIWLQRNPSVSHPASTVKGLLLNLKAEPIC